MVASYPLSDEKRQTDEEIARSVNVSISVVRNIKRKYTGNIRFALKNRIIFTDDQNIAIRKLIGELDDEQQKVVMLIYLGFCGSSENAKNHISKILGIPEEEISSRIIEALKKLEEISESSVEITIKEKSIMNMHPEK